MIRWLIMLALGLGLALDQARAGTVVLAEDPQAVTRFSADPERVRALLARALQTLAATNDTAAAWRQFCRPTDVVGIKINTQAAPLHGTHRALVDAIIAGLREAGLPATNIWVFDRDLAKMRARGFAGPTMSQEVALAGPEAFDRDGYYDNRIAGRLIWGDRLFGVAGQELSTRSHLPRLFTRQLTKLINVPVLQDHEASGLAGCLYNLSLGMVDNQRRFEAAPGRSEAIAEICALPIVRERTVLHILDALVGGFAGGPNFKPHFGWHAGRLYLGTDPVAIDTLGLELIEQKRREAQVPPIGNRAVHIQVASRLGLGESRRERIVVRPAGSDHPCKHDQEQQRQRPQ